jgi:hypothetical protein
MLPCAPLSPSHATSANAADGLRHWRCFSSGTVQHKSVQHSAALPSTIGCELSVDKDLAACACVVVGSYVGVHQVLDVSNNRISKVEHLVGLTNVSVNSSKSCIQLMSCIAGQALWGRARLPEYQQSNYDMLCWWAKQTRVLLPTVARCLRLVFWNQRDRPRQWRN